MSSVAPVMTIRGGAVAIPKNIYAGGIDTDKPVNIQIAKQGKFRFGYIDVEFDNEFFDQLIANHKKLRATGRQVVLDYEHGSHQWGVPPESSRAAGWVEDEDSAIWREDGDLWAKVFFTEAAREFIENDEYRFISIEIDLETETAEGTWIGPSIPAIALTNRPKLTGMEPITLSELAKLREKINSHHENGGTEMDKKTAAREEKIRAALNLSDGSEITAKHRTEFSRLEKLFASTATAPSAEINEKIANLEAEVATLTEIASEGEKAKNELKKKDFEAMLASHISRGAISKAKAEVLASSILQRVDGGANIDEETARTDEILGALQNGASGIRLGENGTSGGVVAPPRTSGFSGSNEGAGSDSAESFGTFISETMLASGIDREKNPSEWRGEYAKTLRLAIEKFGIEAYQNTREIVA